MKMSEYNNKDRMAIGYQLGHLCLKKKHLS